MLISDIVFEVCDVPQAGPHRVCRNPEAAAVRALLRGMSATIIKAAARRDVDAAGHAGARCVDIAPPSLTPPPPAPSPGTAPPARRPPARRPPAPTRTAIRPAHQIVHGLSPFDAIVQAAHAYIDFNERLASVSAPGEGAGCGGVSDGGAVARCDLVRAVRAMHDRINDWPPALAGRAPPAGLAHAIALPVRRQRGDATRPRRAVLVGDLLRRALLDGQSLNAILTAHGWAPQHHLRATLTAAARAALARVADGKCPHSGRAREVENPAVWIYPEGAMSDFVI